MQICKPDIKDIDGLIALSRDFARETDWAREVPVGKIKSHEQAKEWLFGDNLLEVLVAKEKNRVVGYTGVKKYAGGYEASILVDREYRSQGWGKKLIDAVFALIPSEMEVEAWVAGFNELSLKTTPRMGFRLKKGFWEKNLIPGKEFYVYIFVRRGELEKHPG